MDTLQSLHAQGLCEKQQSMLVHYQAVPDRVQRFASFHALATRVLPRARLLCLYQYQFHEQWEIIDSMGSHVVNLVLLFRRSPRRGSNLPHHFKCALLQSCLREGWEEYWTLQAYVWGIATDLICCHPKQSNILLSPIPPHLCDRDLPRLNLLTDHRHLIWNAVSADRCVGLSSEWESLNE